MSQELIKFAMKVSQCSSLPSVQFQKFILQPKVFMNESLISIISDLITSGQQHSQQQKILATVSMNLIFHKRVQIKVQNYVLCWQEYYQHILMNPHMQWKYLMLSINGLKYLLHEMQEEVIKIIMEKYGSLPFYSKLLLYSAIKDHQNISVSNQHVFLRQTIQDFLDFGYRFICNLHQNNQINPKQIKIEEDFIVNLYDWLVFLKNSKDEVYVNRLTNLAIKQITYKIIVEQITYTFNQQVNLNDNFQSHNSCPVNFNNLKLIQNIHNNKIAEETFLMRNTIKGYTLGILQIMISTFSNLQNMNAFDTIPILGLLENIVPFLIKQLRLISESNDSKDYLQTNEINFLILSAINLLNESTRFNFFLQIFEQYKQEILYLIIPFYIKASQQELSAFQSDGDQFIALNQNTIEIGSDNQPQNIKQATAKFLESYLDLLNGVYIQYVQQLGLILETIITNQKKQSVESFFNENKFKMPSIQVIFSVISSIFVTVNKNNENIRNLFYQKFIQPNYLFSLHQPLDKAKFIIFMCYAYGQYFANNLDLGTKYLEFAFNNKNQNQSLFSAFILLMENTINYGLEANIWQHLTLNLESSNNKKQIKLIKKIMEQKINDFNQDLIIDVIRKLCSRIQFQYKSCLNTSHKGSGNQIVYTCLNTLDYISQNYKALPQSPEIVQQIFYVFNTFLSSIEHLSLIQFDKELINILNCILKTYQNGIPYEYFSILPILKELTLKNKQMNNIMETYYTLLLQGRNVFSSQSNKNNSILKKIKYDLQLYVLNRQPRSSSTLLIQSLFLLQNILLVYPELIQESKEVYFQLKEIYQSERNKNNSLQQKQNEKLIASILLYFMSRQYAYGNRIDTLELYNKNPPSIEELLGRIHENRIQIFKEEFGLMFALNVRRLIEKFCDIIHPHPNRQIQFILKCALKLLDYQHHYKSSKNYKKAAYVIKIFRPDMLMFDSFEEINTGIMYLKEKLSKQEVNEYFQIMKNELGSEYLKQLLRSRVFNSTKQRQILHVRRQ